MPVPAEGDAMDKTLWGAFKEFMMTTPEQRRKNITKKVAPINSLEKALAPKPKAK